MAGDGDIDVNDIMERFKERLRPDLKRLLDDGPEAYIAAKKQKKRPVAQTPSSSTLANIDTLLSSKLVDLSPLETQRARHEYYTIFKDNARSMDRFSFLFDDIPFKVAKLYDISEDCSGKKIMHRQCHKLIGEYDVYYHDDKIDWGALKGWDVPSTVNEYDKGLLIIAPKNASSHHLEGRLFYIPESENDDEYYSDEGESLNSDEGLVSEGGESNSNAEEHNPEIAIDSDDDIEEQSSDEGLVSEGVERNSDAEEHNTETAIDSNDDNGEQSSDDDSLTKSKIYEEMRRKWLGEYTFFHFDEQSFRLNQEKTYQNASWYGSGSEFDFGLIKNPDNDVNSTNAKNSVTIFIADENMAFAKGRSEQHYASLDDPFNAGIDREPWHIHLFSDACEHHRANVLDKMKAYRGSWISNLCPPNMILPDLVTHLIWEYWQEGPPPFLFVHKGDLLLLARYELGLPDPDPLFADSVGVTVTREHLVLARPRKK